MQGPWTVVSNIIGGKKMYAVARIRNINETLHSGNIEYYGAYGESKVAAEKLVESLKNREVTE